jgi:hypothetical protein
MQHDRAIGRLIDSMESRRPANVTRGRWASAVRWTHNLHGNSLLPFQRDSQTIAAFKQRLETRLAGEVNMDTIDWIWDEYDRICPGGHNYQRFKALMLEEMERVAADDVPLGMKVP